MDENPTKQTPSEEPAAEPAEAAVDTASEGAAQAGPAAAEPTGADSTGAEQAAPFAEDAEPADLPPEDGAETPAAPDFARAMSIVESLLLVSSRPLSFDKIGSLSGGLSRADVRELVRRLREKYPPESSGILVEEVAKGLQFRTNPANQEHVRRLFDVKPPRFSRAALETLAIVAYRQPVTRLEMEQIRGVDCAASLKTLMERRLVKVLGKKDVPGKPFLFGTTREFLEVFGMGSLSDLPSMRDIEDFLTASRGEVVPQPSAEPFEEGSAPPEGEPLVGPEEVEESTLAPAEGDGVEDANGAPLEEPPLPAEETPEEPPETAAPDDEKDLTGGG